MSPTSSILEKFCITECDRYRVCTCEYCPAMQVALLHGLPYKSSQGTKAELESIGVAYLQTYFTGASLSIAKKVSPLFTNAEANEIVHTALQRTTDVLLKDWEPYCEIISGLVSKYTYEAALAAAATHARPRGLAFTSACREMCKGATADPEAWLKKMDALVDFCAFHLHGDDKAIGNAMLETLPYKCTTPVIQELFIQKRFRFRKLSPTTAHLKDRVGVGLVRVQNLLRQYLEIR